MQCFRINTYIRRIIDTGNLQILCCMFGLHVLYVASSDISHLLYSLSIQVKGEATIKEAPNTSMIPINWAYQLITRKIKQTYPIQLVQVKKTSLPCQCRVTVLFHIPLIMDHHNILRLCTIHRCYVRVPLERASAIGNTHVPLERVGVIGNTVQPNLWRGLGLAKIYCWSRCRCRCRCHAQWLAGALAKAKRWGWMKTSRAQRRRDLRSQARQEGKDVALLD